MKLIKLWRVIGELTEDELNWLFINKYDVDIKDEKIHFTMLSGSHLRVTMPDLVEINIQSYGDAAETMLCLKFNDRLMLFSERWLSDFHGCNVEF
jgi:hypothetical protein